MPRCQEQPRGFPRFNSKADIENDQSWAKYFTAVYGGVPDDGYPICPDDWRVIWPEAFANAGLSLPQGLSHQSLAKGKGYSGDVHAIVPTNKGSGFDSNVWVEAVHCKVSGEKGGAWYFWAPGSGIWIFSGQTKAWEHRKPAEMEILGHTCKSYDCDGKLFRTSKSKFGLDTLQYTKEGPPEKGQGSHMFIDCNGDGSYTCGNPQTSLKAGWNAQHDCECDQNQHCVNCKGVGPAFSALRGCESDTLALAV